MFTSSRVAYAALVIAIAALVIALIPKKVWGEQQLCQLEPAPYDGWHYRTKIPPLPDHKCWYLGPRMKPRSQLYWAEVPKAPNIIAPMEVERPPWARGAAEGWDHKE